MLTAIQMRLTRTRPSVRPQDNSAVAAGQAEARAISRTWCAFSHVLFWYESMTNVSKEATEIKEENSTHPWGMGFLHNPGDTQKSTSEPSNPVSRKHEDSSVCSVAGVREPFCCYILEYVQYCCCTACTYYTTCIVSNKKLPVVGTCKYLMSVNSGSSKSSVW